MFTKRTLKFVLSALALLLIPFFAMQFEIGGVDWDFTDFSIAAALLASVGIALATATCKQIPLRRRVIGFAAVGLIFVLYVHLAVGIVDSWPLAGS